MTGKLNRKMTSSDLKVQFVSLKKLKQINIKARKCLATQKERWRAKDFGATISKMV
jgi:hypothetical protein